MGDFDPDAYLSAAPAPKESGGFDPDAYLSGKSGGDFSWSKAVTDIPSEIANEASAGASDVTALANRDKMGPVEGLMSLPKAVIGAGRVLMSPVTGAARSLIGHSMANLEHKAGEYIAPEIAAKDDPAKMYETAKGDVDTALSAMRPAGAPVKVPGPVTTAPHPTVPGATVTSAPPPAYEWKGPTAAQPKPTGVVEQPETSEFFDAASNHYSNMRGFGVEIHPSAMNGVADNILNELHAEGYRPRNSKVFADVEELRSPAGKNHEIADIESVRKVLQKTAKDPAERDAARRAIGHIDDYLANLKNTSPDVVVNPHFAERVAEEAKSSRGNYAVAKRSQDVDEALEKARRQANSEGSGGNINNAIRQQLKSLRNNKRTMRGWNDAEKAELDNVINGTGLSNAARKAGKFAPHGIVSTVMSAGAGHALMPGVGEVAVPAAGWIAKRVGDRMTQAAAERLQNVVKARSPLGRQNSINAAAQSALAPPVSRAPRLLSSSVAAALPRPSPSMDGLLRQLQGTVPSAAENDKSKGNRGRNNEPDQGAGGKSHGGPILRAIGGAVNHNHNPSEAQKKAGNYAKTHKFFQGLDITIENLKGKARRGVGKDGKPWAVTMPAHYGYLKRTEGADGDHVDCYIGPNEKSDQVFVVDQKDAETGRFDEHKCLIGFNSEVEARKTYRAGFSDGKDRIKHLRRMSMAEFKNWLAKGDTTEQIAHHQPRSAALNIAYQTKRA